MDWREHIVHDPRICSGKATLRGARVFVTNILDSLAEGATAEEILRSFPSLQPVHIPAAIAYAADLTRNEELIPVRILEAELPTTGNSP